MSWLYHNKIALEEIKKAKREVLLRIKNEIEDRIPSYKKSQRSATTKADEHYYFGVEMGLDMTLKMVDEIMNEEGLFLPEDFEDVDVEALEEEEYAKKLEWSGE